MPSSRGATVGLAVRRGPPRRQRGVQRSSRSSADAASQEHHGGGAATARTLSGACAGSRHAHPSTARRGGHAADGGLRLMQQAFMEHDASRRARFSPRQERRSRICRRGLSQFDSELGIHSRRELTDVLSSSGSSWSPPELNPRKPPVPRSCLRACEVLSRVSPVPSDPGGRRKGMRVALDQF